MLARSDCGGRGKANAELFGPTLRRAGFEPEVDTRGDPSRVSAHLDPIIDIFWRLKPALSSWLEALRLLQERG